MSNLDRIFLVLFLLLSFFFSFFGMTKAYALEQDKQLHLGAGCAVSIVTNTVMGDRYTTEEKMVASVVAGSVVGIAKELYDRRHPENHTADARDAIATIAGSALCVKVSFSF